MMFRFYKCALSGVLSIVCTSVLSHPALAQNSPVNIRQGAASSAALISSPTADMLVTVTSPLKNQVVPGKITVKASAQSTKRTNGGLAFWAIYDEGNMLWMDINPDPSINVPLALTEGYHNILVKAYDDSFTPSTVSVPVTASSSGSQITWHACIYTRNGQHYQAMKIYPHTTMTGVLQSQMFYSSGCHVTQWTDQLNDYGTSMTFGAGSGWIFYFINRPNIPGVSAVWTFGNQTSGCVNYSTAPAC